MSKQCSNSSIILRNAIMLYVRMIVIMLVTLYTSRVVLKTIGIEDYGVYNIVGCIVISLSFIQSALNGAAQRYISYEIGCGDKGNISSVFSMSVNIQYLFLFLILLLLETIGLWALNYILSIPHDRLVAANIAYQFSILTFCVNIIRVPYNAILISFERMNVYAWLSILEAVLRLAIVYILQIWQSDKLIEYSILIFIVTLVTNLLYIYYCRKLYREHCEYKFSKNYTLLKQMLGFSSWNLVGGVTGMVTHEGPNYFMNVYLGVSVNAAMGIAKQVGSAVYSFTENFQIAFRPQIVKYYASDDKEKLYDLVFNASKISYYLLFIVSFPFILRIGDIFRIWLSEVPQYTSEFTICILLGYLVNAISSPLWMLAHATGKIKQYQLWISGISCLIIPVAWIVLLTNNEPYYILAFQILINLLIFVYRLAYAKKMTKFPVLQYVYLVFFPCVVMSVVIILVVFAIHYYWGEISWVASIFVSFAVAMIVFLSFGIPKSYKRIAIEYIKTRLK